MINKEHDVLLPIVIKPWKKFTLKDIKSISGKKSESYVHSILKKNVQNKILAEEKVGNGIRYSFNIRNYKAISYGSAILEHHGWNRKNIPYHAIERIAEKIPTSCYSLLVAGSYANNTQKANSDIDIVIIVDETCQPKKVYAELSTLCEMSVPEIHLQIFKNSEFLQMLTEGSPNFGTEVIRKSLILLGGEQYIMLLRKAILDGFQNNDLS